MLNGVCTLQLVHVTQAIFNALSVNPKTREAMEVHDVNHKDNKEETKK